MNKRALIGKLLILAIVVIIIMGATVYLTFSKSGVKFRTGDVTVSVDYDPEEELENRRIVEVDEEGEIIDDDEIEEEFGDVDEVAVNDSLLNITENNNTLINESVSEDDGI